MDEGCWRSCLLFGRLTCKKGTMPSRAMACSRRGAPVRLCSPAPQQEKNEPITITQGDGHDKVPMTRLPFTESPNLQLRTCHIYINWTSSECLRRYSGLIFGFASELLVTLSWRCSHVMILVMISCKDIGLSPPLTCLEAELPRCRPQKVPRR